MSPHSCVTAENVEKQRNIQTTKFSRKKEQIVSQLQFISFEFKIHSFLPLLSPPLSITSRLAASALQKNNSYDVMTIKKYTANNT